MQPVLQRSVRSSYCIVAPPGRGKEVKLLFLRDATRIICTEERLSKDSAPRRIEGHQTKAKLLRFSGVRRAGFSPLFAAFLRSPLD